MGKYLKWWCLILVIIIASMNSVISCKKIVIHKVFSDAPKITEAGYVTLEKIYSIDVTDINLFNKEGAYEKFIGFDSQENMYVADSFQSKIYVYDNSGKLKYSFGKHGEGPNDFSTVNRILIDGNILRVFQGPNIIKNMSLIGEYISKDLIYIENRLSVKNVGDNYYVMRGKPYDKFTKLDLILSFMDRKMSKNRDIFIYNYPPGFKGTNYDFRYFNWLLVTNNGEFYFPESNFDKYSIIHYDKEGKPKKMFGRNYDIKKYSREAENRFKNIYKDQIEKGEAKFPNNPPVINLMFQDKHDNIWALVGETYEDNRNREFENTVDLFDSNGEWLHSIKTKYISKYCIYNNGKIYKAMPMDEETFKKYIEVYEIKYKN